MRDLFERLVDSIRARSGGRRVTRVRLTVGILYRHAPERLRRALSGTEAEDAVVEMERPQVRGECPSCRSNIHSQALLLSCPHCDGPLSLSGGHELAVESLECDSGAEAAG